MKLAILCLVILGLVALSMTSSDEQGDGIAFLAGQDSEAKMNELAAPENGGPEEDPSAKGKAEEAKKKGQEKAAEDKKKGQEKAAEAKKKGKGKEKSEEAKKKGKGQEKSAEAKQKGKGKENKGSEAEPATPESDSQ